MRTLSKFIFCVIIRSNDRLSALASVFLSEVDRSFIESAHTKTEESQKDFINIFQSEPKCLYMNYI